MAFGSGWDAECSGSEANDMPDRERLLDQRGDITTGQMAIVLTFVACVVATMISGWVAVLYLALKFTLKVIAP
jgi:hypothetical protein